MSSGYSVCTTTPLGRSVTDVRRRVGGDREHDLDRPRGCLRVVQLGERHDVGVALLDPVAAGDAEVEAALGDVLRDLLRAQDAHLVDTWVVDGAAVVDVGAARHAEVGVVEQLEGLGFERAFGEHESEHHWSFGES